MARELFATGVWAATLTPVNEDLSIDTDRLISHASWLINSGCHGIGLFGTTGEAVSFSVPERQAALEALLKAGIAPDQIIVGTGCSALTDSFDLTSHALANGCEHVLMLPPFYYKGMSDEGLASSFGEVVERVNNPSLRVYLYHFPKLSGAPITEGIVRILVDRYGDSIAGLKDSGGDYTNTAAMIEKFPEINVFPGSERFLQQGLDAGGAGCITATANTNPRGIREVYDAWKGNGGDTTALQAAATEVRAVVEQYPLVTVQKGLMASHSGHGGWSRVRPPMTPIESGPLSEMKSALDKIGFTLP